MVIIVCEDERLHQQSIQEHIDCWAEETGHEGIKTLIFTSGEDLLEKWQNGLSADILLMDILFSDGMDGMAAAGQIRRRDEAIPIVFVTNSEAYAKEGYAVRAFRYLGKPVRYDDIALCLDVAWQQYSLGHKGYLSIQDAGARLLVSHEDILYIEAQRHYTYILKRGEDEPLKVRFRFTDLRKKLPVELFILCHRSYIVNIMHVRSIRKNELSISTGQALPVSRSQADAVSEAFDSSAHIDKIALCFGCINVLHQYNGDDAHLRLPVFVGFLQLLSLLFVHIVHLPDSVGEKPASGKPGFVWFCAFLIALSRLLRYDFNYVLCIH